MDKKNEKEVVKNPQEAQGQTNEKEQIKSLVSDYAHTLKNGLFSFTVSYPTDYKGKKLFKDGSKQETTKGNLEVFISKGIVKKL